MAEDVVQFSTGTVSRAAVDRLFEVRCVRGRPAATLNGTLPIDSPGSVTSLQGGRLLWLRPGGWLAVVTDDALATQLAQEDAGPWWVFEVTAARAGFRFSGDDPWAVLSLAGPVQDAFGSLQVDDERVCTRLRLAQATVLLERKIDAGRPAFTAWVEAPVADWWWRWWQAQAALAATA